MMTKYRRKQITIRKLRNIFFLTIDSLIEARFIKIFNNLYCNRNNKELIINNVLMKALDYRNKNQYTIQTTSKFNNIKMSKILNNVVTKNYKIILKSLNLPGRIILILVKRKIARII